MDLHHDLHHRMIPVKTACRLGLDVCFFVFWQDELVMSSLKVGSFSSFQVSLGFWIVLSISCLSTLVNNIFFSQLMCI